MHRQNQRRNRNSIFWNGAAFGLLAVALCTALPSAQAQAPLTSNDIPYLKNASIFTNPMTGKADFVWSYKGSMSLSAVETPATSPMGYFAGPGGRVVIYIDGHAKWVPDSP
ncbi:MAG: hypothetical protein OHK0029_13300 [Armatimonadaceae bacterium]